EIRDAGQGGLWIFLLKPCGSLRRLTLGLEQFVDVLTKSRIGEHALNLVARDRLQYNPGVLREFPQRGIERHPHTVGSMVPRPAQVQRKLCERIEPRKFCGSISVCRVKAVLVGHDFSALSFKIASSNVVATP